MGRLVGLRLLLVVGLLSFGVGCGGDDDGGSGDDGDDGGDVDAGDDGGDDGDDGGDDGGVTLGELSDDEARELCEDALDGFGEAIRDFTCYAQAVGQFPKDAKACEAAAADCIEMTDPELEECAIDPEAEVPECANDFTVDDVTACLDATRDQFVAFAESVNCIDGFPKENPDDFELPEECQALEDQCPGTFEPEK